MDTVAIQKLFEAWLVPFLTDTLPRIVGVGLASMAVLFFGSWVVRIVTRIAVVGAKRTHVKSALIDLLAAGITFIGWLLIAAAVLSVLNLNEIAIAIGGSISLVSLAIATAASGNLGDIIAGIFLASDPDFGTGYVIKTGDITGVIERIDLRKTRVRTEDGKLQIIPNKSIESNVWVVEHRPAEPQPAPRAPQRGFPFLPGQRRQGPEQVPPTNPQ
jgi:moderate conductance mechanosensitive channel